MRNGKRILDPASGSRMFWFDKRNESVVFGDIRAESHILCDGRKLEVRPDLLMDYSAMPFPSAYFEMVVFDPPHLVKLGKNSWMAKKYGKLDGDWKPKLTQAFSECFRVLQAGGTLIFKWNETQIPVSAVLVTADREPLFGHKRVGKTADTHWLTFRKDCQ